MCFNFLAICPDIDSGQHVQWCNHRIIVSNMNYNTKKYNKQTCEKIWNNNQRFECTSHFSIAFFSTNFCLWIFELRERCCAVACQYLRNSRIWFQIKLEIVRCKLWMALKLCVTCRKRGEEKNLPSQLIKWIMFFFVSTHLLLASLLIFPFKYVSFAYVRFFCSLPCYDCGWCWCWRCCCCCWNAISSGQTRFYDLINCGHTFFSLLLSSQKFGFICLAMFFCLFSWTFDRHGIILLISTSKNDIRFHLIGVLIPRISNLAQNTAFPILIIAYFAQCFSLSEASMSISKWMLWLWVSKL